MLEPMLRALPPAEKPLKWRRAAIAFLVALFAIADSHAAPDSARTIILPRHVEKLSIGCIGGLDLSGMRYSDKTSDGYSSPVYMRRTFGVYGEYMVSDRWGVRPEIVYVGKGQKIDEAAFQYVIAINSIDLRLPVLYDVFETHGASVYLQLGPYMGIPYGGYVSYMDAAHYWKTNVSDATIAPAEVGVLIGAGARNRFVVSNTEIRYGLDATYDMGLTDNYSSKEHEKVATALNTPEYTIQGTRKHRGVMVRGLVGIPFGSVYRTFCSDCDPEAAFRAAMRLYKGRHYLEASYAFGRVAVKWPTFWKDDSAILYKGRGLENLHLHEAASKAYESGLATYEGSPLAARFHFQLLNVAYKDTAWDEMQSNFDAVQRLSEAHPDVSVQMDANYVMGQALFAQGRLAEARERLESIPDGDPNRPYALFTLGLIHAGENRFAEARQAFDSIVARPPVNKSETDLQNAARAMLGHVLYSLPEPQLTRAVQLYSQVPPGSDLYEEAQLATAWCFVRNAAAKPEYWEDVRRHVANVSARSPLYQERLLVEGYSQLSHGKCDSASTTFQTILESSGKDSISPDTIAMHDSERASLVAMQSDISDKAYRLTLLLPSKRVLAERQAIQDSIGRIAKGFDDHARFREFMARRNKFRNARERIEKDATYGLASSKNCQDRVQTESGGF